jgi:hypothetical protein
MATQSNEPRKKVSDRTKPTKRPQAAPGQTTFHLPDDDELEEYRGPLPKD